jgi:REP element-mobilizing transposase RayT
VAAFVSIRLHLVWATRRRRPWLDPEWRPRLYAQLSRMLSHKDGQLLCAGGARDHLHLYLDCPPTLAVADLVQALKAGSTKWIHHTFAHRREFRWQEGYAAFSVTRSSDTVLQDYIRNQEVHHREQTFVAEYVTLLREHGWEPDPGIVLG